MNSIKEKFDEFISQYPIFEYRVMDTGGDFSDIERSLIEADHHFGTAKEIVLLVVIGLPVLIKARLDDLRIGADHLRDVSHRVAFLHETFGDVAAEHLVLLIDRVIDHEVRDAARLLELIRGNDAVSYTHLTLPTILRV